MRELVGEPVAEPVVRHDRRVELAREGEDEVVRVGARRRLTNDAIVYQLLVSSAVVDLVPERRVDDYDRLESLLDHLLAHGENVRELCFLALSRMGDVGPVDEDDRLAHGLLRALVRMLSVLAAPSFVVSTWRCVPVESNALTVLSRCGVIESTAAWSLAWSFFPPHAPSVVAIAKTDATPKRDLLIIPSIRSTQPSIATCYKDCAATVRNPRAAEAGN